MSNVSIMGKAMKSRFGKWFFTAVVILANLIFWSVPSDVAYNVAQQRDILLGRYTVDRLTTLLVLIPVSLLIINGLWSKKKANKTQKERRKENFKAIAITLSIILSILIFDVGLRLQQRGQYVAEKSYYYRVPNRIQKGTTRDEPLTAFSYPLRAPGYPEIEYTLSVDERGFRNQSKLGTYDIVVVGDSFAEGSGVSDEQTWAVLLGQKSGLRVYNLGISGGTPLTCLETLKMFGLELRPKIVVCLLYEGNDFRSSNFEEKKEKKRFTLNWFYKTSPLRHFLKSALIQFFGPINSNNREPASDYGPGNRLYAVSWLPLAIPDEPKPKYYAFKIKRLLSHFTTKESFKNSEGCKATLNALRQIKSTCSERDIRFVIVYAADKPHILLPLVKDTLDSDKLHAFMSLKAKELPPPAELIDVLLGRLEIQENVLEEFCHGESIEFVSLTEPLRRQILNGSQAYFTYDQHWTPVGHEAAAEALYSLIQTKTSQSDSN